MYDRLYNSYVQQERYSYGGHYPRNFEDFIIPYTNYTNSKNHNFTSNYRQRQSTAWCPVSTAELNPPLNIQPAQIYHKHIGQIPSYTGYIPGAIFRFGKTFGNDTIDAKRWIRGDFGL